MDDVGTVSVVAAAGSFLLAFFAAFKVQWIRAALFGATIGSAFLVWNLSVTNPTEIILTAVYAALPALVGAVLGKLGQSFRKAN